MLFYCTLSVIKVVEKVKLHVPRTIDPNTSIWTYLNIVCKKFNTFRAALRQ